MFNQLKLRPLEREDLSELQDEFFVDGYYRNAIRMCIFQDEFLSLKKSKKEGMQG